MELAATKIQMVDQVVIKSFSQSLEQDAMIDGATSCEQIKKG